MTEPESGEQPLAGEAWPTLAPDSPRPGHWSGFASATREQVAATRRLGHRHLLAVVVSGLAALSALLIVLGVVLKPTPPRPCIQITCDAPEGAAPVENVPLMTIPASGVSFRPFASWDSDVTTAVGDETTSVAEIVYTDNKGGDKFGTLEIAGVSSQGLDAQQIVAQIQANNAPNAIADYVIPGAWVGYHLGYGIAYHESVNSADGSPGTKELAIMAAVQGNEAVVILAQGPQDMNLVNYLGHPTLAKFYVATFADPVINSIQWPRG